MKTEKEIRQMLKDKIILRKKLNQNWGKTGNKGHQIQPLAVECDLLKEILNKNEV